MNVHRIAEMLKDAECHKIEGLKCFVVSWPDFEDLYEVVFGSHSLRGFYYSEDLARKHQLDNFEIRLSSKQEGTYYICSKGEPVLDELWKKKFKEAT